MESDTASKTKNSADTLRDHLANERTYLAWIRTSIGIMAFGFVVEKFSLFINKISIYLEKSPTSVLGKDSPLPHGNTEIFGMILVAIGAIVCILSFFKYKKIEAQINSNTYKPTILLDAMLTLIVFCIGIFLTIYIFNSV